MVSGSQASKLEKDRASPDSVFTAFPETRDNQGRPGSASKSALRNGSWHPDRHDHVVFADELEGEAGKHEAHSHHRKGNAVPMKKVIDTLYSKVLHDEALKPFYEGIDMQHLSHMQQKLMSFVFGGKDLLMLEAPEFDLRAIHMNTLINGKLSLSHWEAFVQHFQATLDSLQEIPDETKASAMQWMRATRDAFRPPTEAEVEIYNAASARPARKCPFAGAQVTMEQSASHH